MAKAILICGKICVGKSYYAEKLRVQHGAVLLSVDEITLALFDSYIGEKHDEICEKTQNYLFEKSLEIIEIGCDVVIDWGFWQRDEREFARNFYESRGIDCEFHYIDISDDDWRINIAKRNRAITEGKASAYFVDDGLAAKFGALFEAPSRAEIDIWHTFKREK